MIAIVGYVVSNIFQRWDWFKRIIQSTSRCAAKIKVVEKLFSEWRVLVYVGYVGHQSALVNVWAIDAIELKKLFSNILAASETAVSLASVH